MKETTWSPDTCSNPACRLVYEWDETLPSDQRIHTFKRAEAICSSHQPLPDHSIVYNTALSDNRRKNLTEGWMLQNLTSVLGQTNPDGVIIWKNGVTYNWSWSGLGDTRVLTISITGINLTTNQKNQIRTFCDSTFGLGKVIIQ